MQYFRLARATRAWALAAVPMIAACGASASDQTGGDPASQDTPMSAHVPGSGTPENPQRSPEQVTPPEGGTAAGQETPAPGASDPASPAPTPTTPEPTIPGGSVPLRGACLSGAEFGSALPGSFGTDYTFPTPAEVDYYMGKGMNVFRVGFRWERLQQSAYAELDPTYLGRLDSLVTYATSKGARVILNPQNFARYYGNVVGTSQVPNEVFADFWKRVATKYASNPNVMFNLVNEPHDMPTEQWIGAANAAIAAIRAAGANNVVVAPGNGWTGAGSWYSSGYGTPNAVAMLNIQDPANNTLYEVHLYLDSDASGTSSSCVSTTIGVERLSGFVKWLRDNGKKGFLGEFAVADNATCNAAAKGTLDLVMESGDVLVGFTWWGAGPWWGDYMYSTEPKNGQDSSRMQLLGPYLAR